MSLESMERRLRRLERVAIRPIRLTAAFEALQHGEAPPNDPVHVDLARDILATLQAIEVVQEGIIGYEQNS